MLTHKKIREKIKNGKVSIGSWLQIPHPDIAEIMGHAGYDWLAVDMEHGGFSRNDFADMFRSIESGGTVPFVRVSDNSMTSIKKALDAGAKGLIFPMIENRLQLDDAISYALYPPEGKRGVGYCRGNLFGKNFDHSLNENKDFFFCAQIEHVNALNHLDDILGHPKLDAVMVGPYDFSGSMGMTGKFDHPDFVAALNQITEKAKKHHIPMGLHIVQPDLELLAEKIEQGYCFVAYGIDALFLYKNAQCPNI